MTRNMTRDMTREDELIDVKSLPKSMWEIKPWWCQPWSIVLTGVAVPLVSWFLLHRLWITLPVVLMILVWWVLFLGIVPAQYAAAVREAGFDTAAPVEIER